MQAPASNLMLDSTLTTICDFDNYVEFDVKKDTTLSVHALCNVE